MFKPIFRTASAALVLFYTLRVTAADTTDPAWAADEDVTIASGDTVTLTQPTAALASLTVEGTLVMTNWATYAEATAITVRNQGTVTCAGPVTNESAMSRVHLKCADLTVEKGGTINVDGKGWRGGDASRTYGYGPGSMDVAGAVAGGSHGGLGSYVDSTAAIPSALTNVYGSASAPITAGSGGYGGSDGGRGGGVVRIEASNRVTVNGSIYACGTSGSGTSVGSGAGGSIYITCNTFDGAYGKVRARGGVASEAYSGNFHSGGGGRVAILFDKTEQAQGAVPPGMEYSADCGPFHGPSRTTFTQAEPGSLYFSSDTLIDRTGATLFGKLDFADVATKWTIDSLRLTNGWAMLLREGVEMEVTGDFEVTGKAAEKRRTLAGGAVDTFPDSYGTRWDVGGSSVYFATNLLCIHQYSKTVPKLTVKGDLIVSSNGILSVISAETPLYADATEPALTNLGALVTVTGRIDLKSVGKIFCRCHPYSGASPVLSAAALSVDAASFIDSNDEGYFGGNGNNAYPGINKFSMSPTWPTSKCGAGHGGAGGWCTQSATAMGQPYDSIEWPVLPGSGGHSNYSTHRGWRGGGVVRIFLTGDAVVDGILRANSATSGNFSGNGAGGTVLLSCHTLTGTGVLSVAGCAGYYYTASSSDHNGGAGGGGRIAVHYDTGSQPNAGITFRAPGGEGVGGGALSGSGDPGTLWFSDDRLIAGKTTFDHKGAIYWPERLWSLSMASLTLEDGLIDLPPGGFVDVTGDVTVNGASVAGAGFNLSEGYFHCGGKLTMKAGHITITGGATPKSDRFKVGGDLAMNGAQLTLTCAETDCDSTLTIGGGLFMTNSALITLRPPCDAVEGECGLAFTAEKLTLFNGCWIYPYSHNTNGASVLFQIADVKLAAGGGFNASAKGYGRTTGTGSQYGPMTTATDGRGVDGGNAYSAVGAGYGGTGGLYQAVSPTYPRGRGLPYGDARKPVFAGCGGAGSYNTANVPGRGGGLIRIESDKFDLNGGSLLADAGSQPKFRSGASGGGIYVRARKFHGGGGIVSAKGGDGAYAAGGDTKATWCMAAGGGGRIAIWSGSGDRDVSEDVSAGLVDPALLVSNPELYPPRCATDGTFYWGVISMGTQIIVR